MLFFFFSSRRRHTRYWRDWSSDVCSSDLGGNTLLPDALVAEMARDQTGGLALPNAPGFGFGLGFSVLRDAAQAASPESVGTWRWGGAHRDSWVVAPAPGLSALGFTHTLYQGLSGRFV